MTQYEAQCTLCGSRVMHLMQSATVERCDECKGNAVLAETIRQQRFEKWGTE